MSSPAETSATDTTVTPATGTTADDAAGRPAPTRGTTTIADVVVAKIAGIAAREIEGVHDLGGQAARVVGRLRETLPGSPDLTQGVSVEVGERQAAVDIGIVAEYGVAIHDLAAGIRSNVINAIEGMTGLEVTEVNITVHDVHFTGEDQNESSLAIEPRVK